MSDVVRVDVDGRVAVVSLNRPEKLNAVSQDVFAGLADAGARIENDDAIWAVLIRGEGRAFCSGLDLGSIGAIGGRGAPVAPPAGSRTTGITSRDTFGVWARMRKPVVAAVHGYALGAGLQLALVADIRIAAEGAVLSAFELTYGLVPDLGGTQVLPALCGPSRAKELIWTARRFSAEEAAAWGIVNRVVPAADLDAEARAFVDDLASRPPIPIRFAKELVDLAGTIPLDEGMRLEAQRQAECMRSADTREAIAAALDRRPGVFTGA